MSSNCAIALCNVQAIKSGRLSIPEFSGAVCIKIFYYGIKIFYYGIQIYYYGIQILYYGIKIFYYLFYYGIKIFYYGIKRLKKLFDTRHPKKSKKQLLPPDYILLT